MDRTFPAISRRAYSLPSAGGKSMLWLVSTTPKKSSCAIFSTLVRSGRQPGMGLLVQLSAAESQSTAGYLASCQSACSHQRNNRDQSLFAHPISGGLAHGHINHAAQIKNITAFDHHQCQVCSFFRVHTPRQYRHSLGRRLLIRGGP